MFVFKSIYTLIKIMKIGYDQYEKWIDVYIPAVKSITFVPDRSLPEIICM